MKSMLLFGIILTSLSSCVTIMPTRFFVDEKSIPDEQFDYPMVVTTDRNENEVWAKLVDLIAVEGYGIQRLDRENGIYISDVVTLGDFTFVNDRGQLENPDAMFVIPKVYYQVMDRDRVKESRQIYPVLGKASYNVRIRKNNSGETFVNVNIVNLSYSGGRLIYFPSKIREITEADISFNDGESIPDDIWDSAKSTGRLEAYIIDMIK